MQNVLSDRENATNSILSRWWNDPSIRLPVLIFVAARILTIVIASAAVRTGPIYNPWATGTLFTQSMDSRQLNNVFTPLVDPWHRWDTGWYLKIAQYGYSAADGTIIFAPLYPALMAVVGVVAGDKLLAGLIVSSAACLAFLIIFYRLARFEVHDDSTALYTLLAFISFPTAFYLLAAYTEATFLVFVAGCFLAARHKRWWIAAVLALLATLTRIQGVALCLPLAWLAFMDSPRYWLDAGVPVMERIRQAVPRLFAVGIAGVTALGFYAYLAFANLGTVTDAYQTYWQLDVRAPWISVIDVIKRIVGGQANFTEIAGFVALLIIVGLMVASIRKIAIPYQIYMFLTLVLILMRYYTPILLNGTMRYVLDFFPAFIALGLFLAKHRHWRPVLFVVGGIFQVILLYLFVRWQWIS